MTNHTYHNPISVNIPWLGSEQTSCEVPKNEHEQRCHNEALIVALVKASFISDLCQQN